MEIDMKTIRTIIGTLSAVLLTFALVAWFSVRRSAAFIQRTIYQGFDQTFVVALVMGCAFLLITIILSVAIASTDDDDDDEEEEEESFRPRHQTRPPAGRGGQPYRRVSRSMEQSRSLEQRSRREEDDYARSRTRAEARPAKRYAEEPPAQRKRERAAEEPDEVTLERREAPVKKPKKAPRPQMEEDGPQAEASEVPVSAPKAPKKAPEPAEDSGEGADAEQMVRCIFCGSEISRNSVFCPVCGKKR